jgi:hypothetical protein
MPKAAPENKGEVWLQQSAEQVMLSVGNSCRRATLRSLNRSDHQIPNRTLDDSIVVVWVSVIRMSQRWG